MPTVSSLYPSNQVLLSVAELGDYFFCSPSTKQKFYSMHPSVVKVQENQHRLSSLTLQLNVTAGCGHRARPERDGSNNTRMCVTLREKGKWRPLLKYLTYFWIFWGERSSRSEKRAANLS